MQTIRDASDLSRLKAQEIEIEAVFNGAGFNAIAPSIIQPADPFLELSGEDIRRRTYVFTDPYANELCLRPDLTIPTCRAYLEDLSGGGEVVRRLYYNGPAFRCQKPGSKRPTEFPQLGLELIGSPSSQNPESGPTCPKTQEGIRQTANVKRDAVIFVNCIGILCRRQE